jgi:hypothetical protein
LIGPPAPLFLGGDDVTEEQPQPRRRKEFIGIRPGDRIRCPDRSTALWHTVVRVGRSRDGTRHIVLRRRRFWRGLGMSPEQRLEWEYVRALGYGLRRKTEPILTPLWPPPSRPKVTP